MSNKELVVELLQAMAEDRADLIEALMAPDVTWWVPPAAAARGLVRPLVGRRDVVDLIAAPNGFFRPGSRVWDVHRLVGEGDMVAAHVNMTAVTGTGVDYSNEYHWLVRFADGRIAEVWEHVDTAYFFDTVGAVGADTTDAVDTAAGDEALAHAQITSLLSRSSQALDVSDFDTLEREVMAPEAVWEVWQHAGQGTLGDRAEGRDAVLAWFRQMLGGDVAMSQGTVKHFIGTHDITVNGDRARSTSHLQAVDTARLVNLACGFVEAEHVRTDDGWRISYYKVDEQITDADMEALQAVLGIAYSDDADRSGAVA
ncbi:hypothetical protein BH10ACT3_BH10ACT3_00740 [soil metagenome]